MKLMRKCLDCKSLTIPVISIALLLIGNEHIECSHCNAKMKLHPHKGLSARIFLLIEVLSYLLVLSLAYQLKSWLALSVGFTCIVAVELMVLYCKPLIIIGERNRVDESM